jgi:hypothetical protein
MCACASSSKKIVYDKILFGKGGGFTGKYDEYFLSKNGNIYKKDATTNSFTKIKDLSRKETISIFKQVDTDALFELGFNHPYNLTSYIEIVKGSVTNRIAWGDAKTPPPVAVTILFDKLMGYVIVTKPISNNMKK